MNISIHFMLSFVSALSRHLPGGGVGGGQGTVGRGDGWEGEGGGGA